MNQIAMQPLASNGGQRPDQPLRGALKRVAVTLKSAGIPFALSGGYASWARGGPEPVHDVDFVLAEEDLTTALPALEDAGMHVVHPPEDWLVKVYDGDAMVDLIYRPGERPVTHEQLAAADEMNVDSVVMPVQSATDLLVGKLLVLTEHYCDLTRLFPHARALREQVDWPELRRNVRSSPFASSFLSICEQLGIVPPPEPA